MEGEIIFRIDVMLARRKMSVTLTDLGRAAAIEKQQYAHRYLGQLVENLGEEDSRELVRLLERCTHIVHSVHEAAKGAAHVSFP